MIHLKIFLQEFCFVWKITSCEEYTYDQGAQASSIQIQ